MTPLKITAYPRSGIECMNNHLTLDGLLFDISMREEYGFLEVRELGKMPDVSPVDLPFQKLNTDDPLGRWYYACSFPEWEYPSEYKSFWVKRFDKGLADLIDFKGKRGKVIIEQGRYKAYHMPTFLKHALSITWYCVGDMTRIWDLLQFATHIGKNTGEGNGRINYWTVEEAGEDYSVYKGQKLMRPIPADEGILYGYRPSYWLPANQTTCLMPP